MRYVLLLLFASCAVTPPRGLAVKFSDDIKLDHDQVLVCGFLKTRGALICMTPEEFRVRVDAAEGDL